MKRRDLIKQALLAAAGTSVAGASLTAPEVTMSPVLQNVSTPVTLKAFRFDHLGLCCSATDAESARRFFEKYCFEVVSPKDVEELTGLQLRRKAHFFGIDTYPYEDFHLLSDELEVRGEAGLSEPDWFYDKMTLPPWEPSKKGSWTRCRGTEFTPPAGELVWTTDRKTVRRGKWYPHEECLFDFEGWMPGEWKDIHGDKIPVVTDWLEYDFYRDVPAPPHA
ncbi:hypothetical protein [Roseimicrobium sp. ORNL1]|uniref:hypothetical protein n=1 Tax=Roseimicrobium sp. ORNL1 TaxID=2711231 RepID=UPI0013E14571|nr:hypothetical protein [Roseimicrobium sp. ORNL1]QIF01651.1 hypothetical protein G5S37_08985 [Roseimicrobium sp. ORNL1]